MTTSFKELVEVYSASATQCILFTAWYGDNIPLWSKVLLHKVEKHHKARDARSMAMYVALFLAEYPREDVPSGVVTLCKAAGLQRKGRMVGYPHADGTYHWFGDK